MNSVIYAGPPKNAQGERADKNFEILVPEEECRIVCGGKELTLSPGEAAAIPPLTRRAVTGKCLSISLEKAILPFKEPTAVKDGGGGIAFAVREAEKYCPDGGGELAQALGGLVAAYITHFSGGRKFSPVVEQVLAEIDKNLSDPTFSLSDSIKKLPLNYDYVRKMFKKETGLTPREYLLKCRMELARGLIDSGMGNRYSRYTVSQIAEACGYAEPLYFTRVFTAYYGAPPSKFMNAARS